MRLLRCSSHSIYGTGSATLLLMSLLLDLLLILDIPLLLLAKEMKLLVSMLVLDLLLQVGQLGKLLKPVLVLVDKMG